MDIKHIFSSATFFSLLVVAALLISGCNRNDAYGVKSGGEGEEPDEYGLQEEDLPGMGNEDEAYPSGEAPRNDVVAGEDNQAERVEYGKADTSYDAQAAQYPADKIREETNLNSNDPLQLESGFRSIEKEKLLSTLNRQKTNIESRIRELEKMPGDAEDATTIEGNINRLKLYHEKIDNEITKVRSVEERDFEEVAESAQATIKGSGALLQSENMRIQRGY